MSKYTRVIDIGGNKCALLPDGTTRRVTEYYGNSGRTKPKYANGARDGDQLLETDTRKVYIFDEDIDDWREL